jgi:anti-sigma28 factor (negative regulator of flagellin synthesis)
MKVNERKTVQDPRVGGLPGTVDTTPAGRADDASSGSGDSVRVSQVARALARLVDHGGALAEGLTTIRPDVVDPLRDAVARGDYQVDFEGTARKLLREILGDLAR